MKEGIRTGKRNEKGKKERRKKEGNVRMKKGRINAFCCITSVKNQGISRAGIIYIYIYMYPVYYTTLILFHISRIETETKTSKFHSYSEEV